MRGMALVFSASSACRSRREYVSGLGRSVPSFEAGEPRYSKKIGVVGLPLPVLAVVCGTFGSARPAGRRFKMALNNKVPSCRSR